MAVEWREEQEVKAEIAREIANVHLQAYGQPVESPVVEVSDQLIAVVMDVALTPVERTLIAGGHDDSVRAAREAYQEAIEPTFRAIVERASGYRVEAVACRTVIAKKMSAWSAEVFRLASAA